MARGNLMKRNKRYPAVTLLNNVVYNVVAAR